ncbi:MULTISPECIES: type IV pilus modification PilV family protein [Geobacter]|uniref:type IV pilus modification PilV family protein n=1 Tax=Geobacter TaxID=28231 RepID=UPI002573CE12|nr:prepilin-type N-terminal cleavage/methylation domain-containing protein [Geobacter sulfurreducens]BEH10941.1 prepilin-type N-terminal cleavage/methylation domain-containing protein [Geobacter sulfurreducens subsp. ethanolicus]
MTKPGEMIRGCLSSQQGMSLVEMLIALLILVVGFLSVIMVLWMSINSGRFTRDMTMAASLGQDMLERFTARSYGSLSATGGAFEPYTTANASAVGYVREVKVEDNVPEAGIKTVTVRVRWSSNGRERSRTFTMLKRDY